MQKGILLAVLAWIPAVAMAAPASKPVVKPMAICVDGVSGTVTARPKCRGTETVLNVKSLVSALGSGPKGEKGDKGDKGDAGSPGPAGLVNTRGCYVKRDEWQLTNDGTNASWVECNDPNTEFMLSDSMKAHPYEEIFIVEREAIIADNDTVPTGIFLGTRSAAKVYQLRAVIVCCQRS